MIKVTLSNLECTLIRAQGSRRDESVIVAVKIKNTGGRVVTVAPYLSLDDRNRLTVHGRDDEKLSPESNNDGSLRRPENGRSPSASLGR